jgi:hypothetical protein
VPVPHEVARREQRTIIPQTTMRAVVILCRENCAALDDMSV